jgi:hypothetical protein
VSFSLPGFWRFCNHLQINSKEYGTIKLAKPYGPQRWFMREVCAALDEDVHDIVCLKSRQIGLSTIVQALDLYWLFTHEGLDGTIVTHDEETFINFRTTLTEYYKNLPKSMKPRSRANNRAEFVFEFADGTMSRLQWQIAGSRASGNNKLGRAKGNAYLHATEMAFWGDEQAYISLRNALAEWNPNRLYIWESTANGFNAFEEMWRIATKAETQRAVFIGWWAHELYRLDRSTPRGDSLFRVYWGESGRMTKEERELANDIKLLYPQAMEFVNGTTEISPEQVAWYRYYTTEKVADQDMQNQEMPWTEHHAFVTTGAQYFSSRELTTAHKRMRGEGLPKSFRIEIQHTLSDCKVLETPYNVSNLLVWEGPVDKAHYVLGADPAFGSSDWADRFVISVWRGYADGIDQVAEYATADCLPYAFAWIMCYLAGCYAPCAWNLEVNGPGAAVLAEIDNLRRMQFAGDPKDRQTMKNFLGGMKEFLYARFDSLSRMPTARGTQSTLKEKNRYMDMYKDYFSRGMARPRSRYLLEEMKWVAREAGCAPAGSARHKDDRVIAGALAVQMWHDKLRARLLQQGITRGRTEADPTRRINPVEAIVARQRKLLGM